MLSVICTGTLCTGVHRPETFPESQNSTDFMQAFSVCLGGLPVYSQKLLLVVLQGLYEVLGIKPWIVRDKASALLSVLSVLPLCGLLSIPFLKPLRTIENCQCFEVHESTAMVK